LLVSSGAIGFAEISTIDDNLLFPYLLERNVNCCGVAYGGTKYTRIISINDKLLKDNNGNFEAYSKLSGVDYYCYYPPVKSILHNPQSICVDACGKIFIANTHKHCITVVNSDSGEWITEIGGNFSFPRGVHIHENYLLVADTQSDSIKIFKSNIVL